jgi:hypothetical protein
MSEIRPVTNTDILFYVEIQFQATVVVLERDKKEQWDLVVAIRGLEGKSTPQNYNHARLCEHEIALRRTFRSGRIGSAVESGRGGVRHLTLVCDVACHSINHRCPNRGRIPVEWYICP